MKPSDFFRVQDNPNWDLTGLDPWRSTQEVFDTERVERFRLGPQDGVADLDAAYAMTQLAHTELAAFGTDSTSRLNDEELSILLRVLRALLGRLDVKFDPPFRDFQGFRGYWTARGMSGTGGWGRRRHYLDEYLFNPVFSRLSQLESEESSDSVRGVDGHLQNIIFASIGLKPKIVLRDAINNIVEVVEHGDDCLFYDRRLSAAGLTWADLVSWWRDTKPLLDQSDEEVAFDLYPRLSKSLASPPEKKLFRAYGKYWGQPGGSELPALLPQVYLHYDPRTRKERNGQPSVLMRERMDFLFLLPGNERVVIEVDGKQHYAEGEIASPKLYSEMVAEDRKLRLRGYEIFRFGGHELMAESADSMLQEFFEALLARHGIDAIQPSAAHEVPIDDAD